MNDPTPAPVSGFPRWLKWSLLGGLAALVLFYGAVVLYAKVINDSPDEFGTSDLDAALTDTGAESDTGVDGDAIAEGEQVWTIADGSQVGYRVRENLFGVDTEAVGRTERLTGTFVVDDDEVVRGEFVVDVASIESDDGRRDGQFRGRIMSTDRFPEATFTLTEAIDLGTEPVEGAEVATTATGELTLRGVTNTVTFDLTAEQRDGRVGVLGSIPVVFADYSIANPSFGGVTTEDEGLLEFVLVFEPAGRTD